MKTACAKEINELHHFFTAWFTGGDASFDRFSDAMDPAFTITFPTGGVMGLNPLTQRVKSARKAYAPGEFSIEILIKDYKPLGDGHALMTYEEWHITRGKREGRISSAVFRHDPNAPAGVVWLHLHETMIPNKSDQ